MIVVSYAHEMDKTGKGELQQDKGHDHFIQWRQILTGKRSAIGLLPKMASLDIALAFFNLLSKSWL